MRIERVMMWLVGGAWGAGALAVAAGRLGHFPQLRHAALYLFGGGVLVWSVPPIVAIVLLTGQKVVALLRQ